MLQLESFLSSSTLPRLLSEVCLSLQPGDGFPSGSCSQRNHSRPSQALFTEKGLLLCYWSHWQSMLSRSPVSQGGKVQVGTKVALVDQGQGQRSFTGTHK